MSLKAVTPWSNILLRVTDTKGYCVNIYSTNYQHGASFCSAVYNAARLFIGCQSSAWPERCNCQANQR